MNFNNPMVLYITRRGRRLDKHLGHCRLRENNKWYCEFYAGGHSIEVDTYSKGQRWVMSFLTLADLI